MEYRKEQIFLLQTGGETCIYVLEGVCALTCVLVVRVLLSSKLKGLYMVRSK